MLVKRGHWGVCVVQYDGLSGGSDVVSLVPCAAVTSVSTISQASLYVFCRRIIVQTLL